MPWQKIVACQVSPGMQINLALFRLGRACGLLRSLDACGLQPQTDGKHCEFLSARPESSLGVKFELQRHQARESSIERTFDCQVLSSLHSHLQLRRNALGLLLRLLPHNPLQNLPARTLGNTLHKPHSTFQPLEPRQPLIQICQHLLFR